MKKLNQLDGFWYYDIDANFNLAAELDREYFKSEILEKEQWNDQPISELLASVDKPAFDSGIICAKSEEIMQKGNCISQLKCFIAPYQLMSATIGTVKPGKLKKVSRTVSKGVSEELAVGIGMVLSIIATKGSVESGNRNPYIMLVKRENARIRPNELDAAVVEGLNSGDFHFEDEQYIARLSSIVRRALEEERGLNCSMLESLRLLHMPKRYYLGYDEQYHQWNFFGTVVVDCTIEELIREGCYFTKDKFESKGITSIPMDPEILYYYLSFDKIPIHNGLLIQRKMWNTAWASIMFAERDFTSIKRSHAETVCLFLKKHPLKIWYHARSFINKVVSVITSLHNGIDVLCAILTIPLIITTLLYIFLPDWGEAVTILSTIITSITCLCVVAITRNSVISRTDIVNIDTYGGSSGTTYHEIPETRVFRNVCLVDGNIAEKERSLFFAFQHDCRVSGKIVVQRKCNAFYDDANDPNAWNLRDIQDCHVEHICWKIVSNPNSSESIRIIVPCIIRRQIIVFSRDKGAISHYIDFTVPYKEFVGKDDQEIKQMLSNFVKQKGVPYLEGIENMKVNFKFLLKAGNGTVVVGFVESDVTHGPGETYQLCYDLTNTTFEQNMKDDVTRVACEYAIAEYIGYRMALR